MAALLDFVDAEQGSTDNKTMVGLLEDVAKLMRPRRITVTGHSTGERERTVALLADHPFATTIIAISDISSLFSNYVGSSAAMRRGSPVVMKLTFYAAHILSAPSSHLYALADEALLLSKSMGKESR